MAKPRKRTKKTSVGNGRRPKPPPVASSGDDKSVITLRIDGDTRRMLHEYALTRARDEGRNVSLNQCVIELIRHGA